MLALVIHKASVADIPSIAEVRSGALTDHEMSGFSIPESGLYYSKEHLMEIWETDNRLRVGSEVFVAVLGSRVVGFIVFNMNNRDDNIDNVVVAKGEQGKGVGRALVEFVENLARSRGMNVITTDTTENEKGIPWKAYGFWKRMGYKDTGIRMSSSHDFRVIPLVKKLS